MEYGRWRTTGRTDPLSPREQEATLLAVNDLSVKQIAQTMRIQPSAAQSRLDSARHKLKQRTLRGLVVEALRLGVIEPAVSVGRTAKEQAC